MKIEISYKSAHGERLNSILLEIMMMRMMSSSGFIQTDKYDDSAQQTRILGVVSGNYECSRKKSFRL